MNHKQRVAAEPVIERLLEFMVEFQRREGYGKTIPHAELERILGMPRALNSPYYNCVSAARKRLEEEHHIHTRRKYNEGYTLLDSDKAMAHTVQVGNDRETRNNRKTVEGLENVDRESLSETAKPAHEFVLTRWRLKQAHHKQNRAIEIRVAKLLEPQPVRDGQPLLKATAG